MPDITDAVQAAEQASVVLIEATEFHAARIMVEQAQKNVVTLFHGSTEPRDAYNLGRLSESLEAAGDALFNVLNIASAYCQCGEAKTAIKDWYARNGEQDSDAVIA